jgi:molybdenum cofactor cytidylyltransferase
MRFGPVPLDQAAGAILAHSVTLADGTRLRKGQCLGEAEIARLRAGGMTEVTVARPDPGDVPEDEAARRLGAALLAGAAGPGLRATPATTGRVNLVATAPGVLRVDPAALLRINLVHPAITLATLPAWQRVTEGTLCATAKIITYAVPGPALAQACAEAPGALRLCPVVLRTASLILTEVPGLDARLIAKGRKAVEGRVRALGLGLVSCTAVPHRIGDIAAALTDSPGEIVLIQTGSATSDAHDTAPAALRAAGGEVLRFGMPVDPGNLLFHGRLDRRPVIGLPGCARSPALNGADWVLERLVCGIDLTGDHIAGMAVGGLLKEIPQRGRPRDAAPD